MKDTDSHSRRSHASDNTDSRRKNVAALPHENRPVRVPVNEPSNELVITAATLHSVNVGPRNSSRSSSLTQESDNSAGISTEHTNNVEGIRNGGTVRTASTSAQSRNSTEKGLCISHNDVLKYERVAPHRTTSLPGSVTRGAVLSREMDLEQCGVHTSAGNWDEIRTVNERCVGEPVVSVFPRRIPNDAECDLEEEDYEVRDSSCTTKTKIFSAVLVVFAILALSTTSALIYLKLHTADSQQPREPVKQQVHMTERLQNQTVFCGVLPLKYAPSTSVNTASKTPTPNSAPSDSNIQLKGIMQHHEPNQAPRQGSRGTAKAFPVKVPLGGRQATNKAKSRIVGGSAGIIRWQVSLWLSGQMKCGGSIIMNNWILTAAHCTQPHLDVTKWTVYAGASVRSKRREFPAQNRSVIAIIQHEKFHDDGTLDYDVSLMRLDKPFIYNEEIKPICVPPQDFAFAAGMHCFVSGWGQMDGYGILPHPDMLQYAQVDIIADSTCNSSDWLNGKVTNRMLCAGKEQGIQDACEGDSGGPLSCYWQERGAWMLAGSVSWGDSCGEPKKPGVYARISFFTDWIWKHIGKWKPP